ncbi:MAG: hypothetical protein HC857_03660 [Synechococcales cyanobacterium RU_4_20]|nr:hypothetical protein [Synechococcales cyanobacterium RU_4_20]NJR69237.1 hypothetical protein [Synechococcales cyanobacterium CRU_2_2]
MNPNDIRSLQLRGLGVWILTLVLLMGISSILPDWLINLFFVLVGLAILAPIAGFFGLRWWLQRNLVQSACPVCGASVGGLQQTNIQCPSCGEPLQLKDGEALRITPPGTVDVRAVEVMTVEATTVEATAIED